VRRLQRQTNVSMADPQVTIETASWLIDCIAGLIGLDQGAAT
jgi:hypothetical protein